MEDYFVEFKRECLNHVALLVVAAAAAAAAAVAVAAVAAAAAAAAGNRIESQEQGKESPREPYRKQHDPFSIP